MQREPVNTSTHCAHSSLMTSLRQTHGNNALTQFLIKTLDLWPFQSLRLEGHRMSETTLHISTMSNYSIYPSSSLTLLSSAVLVRVALHSWFTKVLEKLPNCQGIEMLFCVKADSKSIPWNTGFGTLMNHIPHVQWQINWGGWDLLGLTVSSIYSFCLPAHVTTQCTWSSRPLWFLHFDRLSCTVSFRYQSKSVIAHV